MKRMKRFCALLLALCMMFALAPAASAANGTIVMNLNSNKMTVNGSSVAIDSDASIKPQVKKVNGNGYTMLPLRAVVEAMGGTVAYNASTKVITLTYNGNTLTHTIGSTKATVNGTAKTMDVASYADNNRTYVHLRAIELLSSSVKVNWNASSPNTVTITYPQGTSSTKNVSLTIVNAATGYLQLSSLKLAPAGTKNYSGNLLSTTLLPGGQRTLTMAIAPGKYDLQGVEATTGMSYTWTNLDFSNIQSKATLTLTSLSQYVLSVDSSLSGDKTSSVTIINATGGTITGISAYPTAAGASSATRVSSAVVANGSATSFNMAFSSAAPYYALQVQFSSGYTITYPSIRIDSGYMTLTLKGDGTYTYSNSTASSSGVYFVNRTGSKISTLQMKIGSSGSWSADLLSSSLKSGDYIEIPNVSTSEVRNQTVYFRTSTSGTGKSVKVTSTTKNSVVFTLKSSLSVQYNVDPSEKNLEEGLYVENDSGYDIDWLRVLIVDEVEDDLDRDDYKNWDIDDYFDDDDEIDYDASDYYEEIEDLEDGEYEFIDEWDIDDLAGNELYFEVKYEDSTNPYYGSIDLSSSNKWDFNAYITIEDRDSTDKTLDLDDTYDFEEDADDEETDTGLLFYNKTGKKIKAIYVSTSSTPSATSSYKVIGSLSKNAWKQADDYDSYKSDVKGKDIYYRVVFDDSSESSYTGSFEDMSTSSKDNVCITLKGKSADDTRKYNWSTSNKSAGDSALYLFNKTGYDVDRLYIGIGSTRSASKDSKNIDEYEFDSFDDDELLEIDDFDVDDIEDMYIYINAELDIDDDDDYFDDDEFDCYIKLKADDDDDFDDDDFEYVVLEMTSKNKLNDKYNADLDDYE